MTALRMPRVQRVLSRPQAISRRSVWVLVAATSCGRQTVDVGASSETSGGSSADSSTSVDTRGENADSTGGPWPFDPCVHGSVYEGELLDVDTVKDLDNDGRGEVLAFERFGSEFRVHAFSPAVSGDDTLTFETIQTIMLDDSFPLPAESRVASVGDVNGDMVPDLALAAVTGSPDEYHVKVFVLLGEISVASNRAVGADFIDGDGFIIDGPPATIVPPGESSGGFDRGISEEEILVAAGGDLNSDGLQEIVIGLADGRSVWVVLGREAPDSFAISEDTDPARAVQITYAEDATPAGPVPGLVLPWGDANGDGFVDLAMAAPFAVTSPSSEGFVAIMMSANILSARTVSGAELTFRGSAFDAFGFTVVPAGDRDLDGRADGWIGVPRNDDDLSGSFCDSSTPPGSAYLAFGAPSGSFESSEMDVAEGGRLAVSSCGVFPVAGQGDWDGDGAEDLLLARSPHSIHWLSGASVPNASDLPIAMPSDSGRWEFDGCSDSDGVEYIPDSHISRFALFLSDSTGDGADEAIVAVADLNDSARRRLFVLPGRASDR